MPSTRHFFILLAATFFFAPGAAADLQDAGTAGQARLVRRANSLRDSSGVLLQQTPVQPFKPSVFTPTPAHVPGSGRPQVPPRPSPAIALEDPWPQNGGKLHAKRSAFYLPLKLPPALVLGVLGRIPRNAIDNTVANPPQVLLATRVSIYRELIYSLATYCRVFDWSCRFCQSEEGRKSQILKVIDTPGAQGYIIYSQADNIMRAVFKPMSSIAHVKRVFAFKKVDWPMTVAQLDSRARQRLPRPKVHSGFLAAGIKGFQPVRDAYLTLRNQGLNPTVYFSGYSFGGGMAQIVALKMADIIGDPLKIKVFTYGGPRVGDEQLALLANSHGYENYRVVYGNDGIARIPTLGQGYRHAGMEVFMRNKNTGDIVLFPQHPQAKEHAAGGVQYEARYLRGANLRTHFLYWWVDDDRIKCKPDQAPAVAMAA